MELSLREPSLGDLQYGSIAALQARVLRFLRTTSQVASRSLARRLYP